MAKIYALTVALCLFVFSGVCAAAENWHFVDASGFTGYYVDVGTITFEDEQRVNAKVAVIKASVNRMYVYTMHFDREAATYQTLYSEIRAYDTKEVLTVNRTAEPPHPYGLASPMGAIVSYIYEYSKK
ncbi:MAG: hypothetical protein IJ849_03585 [Selenomonadaceae bacterium]|nr:hypothetical protein [Selenomonadaceae bacterium]